MRPLLTATKQFFAQIWDDAMLVMLLFVPILMGVAFRIGVPVLESFICKHMNKTEVLATYYPVFDMLLSVMTPIMFTTAGALVILDEADTGISRALVTSPLGKNGYLASRIVVPTVIATVYCIMITSIFSLSSPKISVILLMALCSGALSMTIALMIPAFARNKVEGMALSKLSGLFMLGLPAALLLPNPVRYISGILPTFWMTELIMKEKLWSVIPAIITAVLYIKIFAWRFGKRVL